MIRSRLLPALALAVGLVVGATVGAQPPAVRPAAQPAPVREPALPLVPASSGAFLTLKVSDLAKHPDLKPVFAQLAKNPDALAGHAEAVGVLPTEVDRLTLFWPRFGRGTVDAPVLVVTTVEPFNEARVLKNLKAQPVFDGDGGGFGGRRDEYRARPRIEDKQPFAPPKAINGGEVVPLSPKTVLPEGALGGKDELDSCAASAEGDVADPLCYALERGPFGTMFIIDERTLMFLPTRRDAELATLALLGASLKKNATGPLADALADASKHTLAAGVYLPPLLRELTRRPEPELVPYTALLATRTAVLTGDLDKTAKFALALKFDDAAGAKRAAPVLEEGIATVFGLMDSWAGELRDSRDPLDKSAAPLVAVFATGMKKAAVKVDGSAVLASAEVDVGPVAARVLGEMLHAVQSRKQAELRTNNLKQIGLALHNYHDVNGKFPANVYGPKGEPLLSWRVQLLPYLEQNALYLQFKMDEPWDGPNNKPLIEKMPNVFSAPDREHVKGKTFYQGFSSPEKLIPVKGNFGRPWLQDGEKDGLRIASITDGLSNTIAVVEAGAGVTWSKPEDLPFGGAVPRLGEKGWDRAPALRFDGSVFMCPTNLKPDAFWPHVTINGGEVTEDLDERRPRPFGGRPSAPGYAPAAPKLSKPAEGDDTRLRAEVLSARLAESKAALANALAQVEVATLLVDRVAKLESVGKATQEELAKAKADLAERQARAEALRRQVDVCEAQLRETRERDTPRK